MSLQEKSSEIEKAFVQTKMELKKRLEQISEDINVYTEEYKVANTHGDRSENAAFEDSVRNLTRAQADYAEAANLYNAMSIVTGLDNYKPVGIIVLYTTVRLKCLEDGTVYEYRIFPKKISDIDRGILSEESRIGKALLGRTKGETIKVVHALKGVELNYLIEDIF